MQAFEESDMRNCRSVIALSMALCAAPAIGGEWMQFRGAGGMGVSDEKGVPVKWSSTENIAWKTELPGPGSSCPVTVRNRVYLTSYTGYGLEGIRTNRSVTSPMKPNLCSQPSPSIAAGCRVVWFRSGGTSS